MTESAETRVAIRRLEDLEAIKRLKYKYLRCVDTKSLNGLAECFTEDATTSYEGGKHSLVGREAIMRFFQKQRLPSDRHHAPCPPPRDRDNRRDYSQSHLGAGGLRHRSEVELLPARRRLLRGRVCPSRRPVEDQAHRFQAHLLGEMEPGGAEEPAAHREHARLASEVRVSVHRRDRRMPLLGRSCAGREKKEPPAYMANFDWRHPGSGLHCRRPFPRCKDFHYTEFSGCLTDRTRTSW